MLIDATLCRAFRKSKIPLHKIQNMKKTILLSAILASGILFGCNSKNDNAANSNNATGDTSIVQHPTTVQKDSTLLSDDSATVKTAKGVTDEEKNAIQQEKKEAQILKADKQKQEKQ